MHHLEKSLADDTDAAAVIAAGQLAARMLEHRPPLDPNERARLEALEDAGHRAATRLRR